MRLNKSLKTLHEEKGSLSSSYSAILKKTVPSKLVDFSEPTPNSNAQQGGSAKRGKGLNNSIQNSKPGMPRSSSASTFERDDSAFVNNSPDKREQNYQNINGNIIHVTVNNYIAPMNNVNNVINNSALTDESTRFSGKKLSKKDRDELQDSMTTNGSGQKPKNGRGENSGSKGTISNTVSDILNSNDSFNKILNDPNVDKSKKYRKSIYIYRIYFFFNLLALT